MKILCKIIYKLISIYAKTISRITARKRLFLVYKVISDKAYIAGKEVEEVSFEVSIDFDDKCRAAIFNSMYTYPVYGDIDEIRVPIENTDDIATIIRVKSSSTILPYPKAGIILLEVNDTKALAKRFEETDEWYDNMMKKVEKFVIDVYNNRYRSAMISASRCYNEVKEIEEKDGDE